MSKSYSVYVGDLPTTVSTEQLQNLFCQVGQILHVWINPLYKTITYGFIEFSNEVAAEEACKRFNGLKLDFSQIKVKLSEKTKNELSSEFNKDSILLELPKKTGTSKNHLVKLNLLKDLRENKEIVRDFVVACEEMEDIPFCQQPNIIKTASEPTNLTTIETTVTRYFKPPCKKNTLQVDFDLSKGKLLTNEQHDKFFNVQFTKPRPVVAKQIIKTKPFAFDYRSVCDI